MSENKLWSAHQNPVYADLENTLTETGSGFLLRVHRDILQALELPAQSVAVIKAAYRAETIAKADEPWFTAQRTLKDLRAYGTSPIPPALYKDLAQAVTEKWYIEGRLENRVQTQVIATWLISQLEQGKRAPKTLEYDPNDTYFTTLKYAQAQAAQYISSLADTTRREIALTVYNAELTRAAPQALSDTLLERFSILNRDWRRIAITEISSNRSNAMLAAYPDGTPMLYSAAKDACKHCLYHHDKTYTLVAPEAATNAATQIWVGKAPRPRGIDPREWVRIGMHPVCRCRWIAQTRKPAPNASIEAEIKRIQALARVF